VRGGKPVHGSSVSCGCGPADPDCAPHGAHDDAGIRMALVAPDGAGFPERCPVQLPAARPNQCYRSRLGISAAAR
jgi:hypothetical protein